MSAPEEYESYEEVEVSIPQGFLSPEQETEVFVSRYHNQLTELIYQAKQESFHDDFVGPDDIPGYKSAYRDLLDELHEVEEEVAFLLHHTCVYSKGDYEGDRVNGAFCIYCGKDGLA